MRKFGETASEISLNLAEIRKMMEENRKNKTPVNEISPKG